MNDLGYFLKNYGNCTKITSSDGLEIEMLASPARTNLVGVRYCLSVAEIAESKRTFTRLLASANWATTVLVPADKGEMVCFTPSTVHEALDENEATRDL